VDGDALPVESGSLEGRAKATLAKVVVADRRGASGGEDELVVGRILGFEGEKHVHEAGGEGHRVGARCGLGVGQFSVAAPRMADVEFGIEEVDVGTPKRERPTRG
jgi:hypothetical protein